LRALLLEENDILVSLDVVSLFTSIPIEDTVKVISRHLSTDKINLPRCCLQCTYFLFNGEFYSQERRAAMGSPLSPVAANLFMEKLEREALEISPNKPKCCWRYVDYVFLVWSHGLKALEVFRNHMSS